MGAKISVVLSCVAIITSLCGALHCKLQDKKSKAITVDPKAFSKAISGIHAREIERLKTR